MPYVPSGRTTYTTGGPPPRGYYRGNDMVRVHPSYYQSFLGALGERVGAGLPWTPILFAVLLGVVVWSVTGKKKRKR